jgi:hypothetical protein
MSITPKFCSQCAAPLRPGSKFCTGCGTTVGVVVPTHTPVAAEPLSKWNNAAWLLPAPWLWRHGKRGLSILYAMLASPVLLLLVGTLNRTRAIRTNWPANASTAKQLEQNWGVNYGVDTISCMILYLIVSIPVGLKANRWAQQSGQEVMEASLQKKCIAAGGILIALCLAWGIYVSYYGYAAQQMVWRLHSQ